MASFLDGLLKKQIAQGFKNRLLKGVIRRDSVSSVNEYGDRTSSGSIDYPFQGFRENFSALYHAQAGIPESDVKILVILGLTSVTPVQTDKVYISSKWHQVRRVLEIDPAGATASVQAYEIPTP